MWPVLISAYSAALGQLSDQILIQDPAVIQSASRVQIFSTDPIHVRIFPHLLDYLPEDRDLDSTQVILTSSSPCNVFSADPTQPVSTGTWISTESSISLVASQLNQALWIECSDPLTVVRGASDKISSYSYNGPFYAHAITVPEMVAADGSITPAKAVVEVISVVPVETYLRGVVASEMPYTWPLESLKAQAIAARTYAIFHMQLSRALGNVFYDVDDTTLFQAFTGVTGQTAETDAAISDTADQIMTYQGVPIQAFFSASSGGYTEDASVIWPTSLDYCQSKPEIFVDPGLDGGVYAPWTTTLNFLKIRQDLAARQYIPITSPIAKIEIQTRQIDISGRALQVHFTYEDGSVSDLAGTSFQRTLGLRSTLMTFSRPGATDLVVSGKGFGHGVGMSQYGAQVLAQTMSWNASEILNFYYTGIQIGAQDISKQ